MSDELKTWPERIWLQSGEMEPEPYPGLGEYITWCDSKVDYGDVEYIRADLAAPAAPAVQEPTCRVISGEISPGKCIVEVLSDEMPGLNTLLYASPVPAIPPGYQLSLIEPTEEMIAAGDAEMRKGCADPIMHVWDAMHAAAPKEAGKGGS